MNKRYVVIAAMMLVLAALACNRTVPTPTPQPLTSVPTLSVGDDETPVSPTDTPLPEATTPPSLATPTQGTPVCVYNFGFVLDVTIPDDTELESGVAFVKTWRVRNSGTCAWESGTAWAFYSGDKLSGPDSVSVPIVEPGSTVDISVNLVAPATPGTYTGYWQMRRPNGRTFGTPSYVRIIVAGDQKTATATPTASATAEPGVGPTIKNFRANVEEADPGDTITLEWETEDATSVTLYHLMPTGQLGSYWDVEASGTFDYEIDIDERNSTGFVLFAGDEQGYIDQATLFIVLRCPDLWFFAPAPDECPSSPPIISDAAEQHFEHGTMIWVMQQDLIYVLFDDDQGVQWRVFSDEWEEGEPEDDPTLVPPTGFFQPVRGFGLVWRQNSDVSSRLGWAADIELGFSTFVQYTSRAKYNDVYMRSLDGKVWRLLPMSSGWEKVP